MLRSQKMGLHTAGSTQNIEALFFGRQVFWMNNLGPRIDIPQNFFDICAPACTNEILNANQTQLTVNQYISELFREVLT